MCLTCLTLPPRLTRQVQGSYVLALYYGRNRGLIYNLRYTRCCKTCKNEYVRSDDKLACSQSRASCPAAPISNPSICTTHTSTFYAGASQTLAADESCSVAWHCICMSLQRHYLLPRQPAMDPAFVSSLQRPYHTYNSNTAHVGGYALGKMIVGDRRSQASAADLAEILSTSTFSRGRHPLCTSSPV